MLRTENLYVLKIFVRLTTMKVVVNSSLDVGHYTGSFTYLTTTTLRLRLFFTIGR